MMMPLPTKAIEPFVRECLGCECPAEVFDEVESDVRLLSDIHYQRLLAGKRLLVYLVLEPGGQSLVDVLRQLHRLGISERDSAGYNRLRMVFPAEPDDSVKSQLIAAFVDASEGDQKVHLHYVPQEQLARY